MAHRFLLRGIVGILAIGMVLVFAAPVLAKPLLLDTGYSGSEYFSYVQGADTTGAKAVVQVVDNILKVLRDLVGPILVGLFVYISIRMIVAYGEEEEIKKMSKYILYLLVGLAFIVLAGRLRDILSIVGGPKGSFLSDGAVKGAGDQVSAIFEGVVIFMRYLLGGIALFYTVRSGALIIFAAGQEDEVTKQKEVFMWGFVGFVVIMISDALIHYVVFPAAPGGIAGTDLPNVEKGIGLIVKLINLLLSLIGGLAILTLVAGGVLYSVSAGSEEKAKQATSLIYGSLLGLLIAFSSYTIVSEFTPGQREISRVSQPEFEQAPQLPSSAQSSPAAPSSPLSP